MRIGIHTLGTRGDVQPYVALARSLKARGHQVQLAAPVQFSEFAADHGVSFRGLPAEFLALLNTAEGKAAVAGGKGFSAGFKLLKEIRPLMRKLLDGEWQMANDFSPNMILYHPKSIAAPYIASALDVPHVLASPVPGLTPTSAFPSPLLPFSSLGPFNRVSHSLAIHAAELLFARELKAWRKGTPGLDDQLKRKSRAGTLYAYSPAVLPKPDDWGPDVLVTGYWFLDEPGWQPDPDLEAFLDAGPPPVYFGFGSMPGLDPEKMTGIILDALAVTDKRGLLAVGGGAIDPGKMSDRAFFVKGAPHDVLLPRASAAVHHGGAGTTAASLRAGLPTQIIPFFGDQPFWGRRVEYLGAGPAPLDRKTLNAPLLAQALIAMDDPAMRSRANALGAAIRTDRGIETAIDFLERVGSRASKAS
ncbi:glycosyltransferase [Georhizobium profundi]|uniref:Glycosyltransferase n=2 Tax=Georhizobium profundi TaxID=2341112 RepID=A0A3Q8XQ89_9HYPH|nr:glycosyltransferase [Georhizobium profundi]AZN71356.1 glycosyltransferase [Georhizobium profundi]